MTNTTEFSENFQKVLNLHPAFVAFDFSGVKFVDSSGIGIIISLVNELKKNGTQISLFNMHKSLFSVFKLSGLYHIMDLYRTPEEFYEKYPEWINVDN